MTDADFLSWVNSPTSIKCILVEVQVYSGGTEITRYLSNKNYVTKPTDTPANQTYNAVLSGSVTVSEKISIDGSASMSFGDVEIVNHGEMDGWLSDVWVSRPISIYVGDVSWNRTDFRKVFDGTVSKLGSRSRDTLNIVLRDKSERLNNPISEVLLGGTTDNKNVMIPLCFGEVHNVEPLLIDPATLKYQVHNGAIESIIEVRDNGVPVSFTPNVSTGTFTLSNNPAGVITCSVQGDKTGGTYRNKIADLVQLIVTTYGVASVRFTNSDIDLTNLSSFNTSNPQPVGIYISDKTNILDVCSQLAKSVGAQVIVGKDGLLRILKIDLAGTSPTAVDQNKMFLKSLQVQETIDVVASVKLGFCKNWTVQMNLQTGIPEKHRNLFETEWLTTVSTDSSVASIYKLSIAQDQTDTMLLVETDAQAESTRRLNLWKQQRFIYSYSGTPDLILEKLGNYQTLYNPRFSMQSGKTGQIIGLTQDWSTCKTTFEVLV